MRKFRFERHLTAVRIAAIAVLFAACGTDGSLPTSSAPSEAAQLQPSLAVVSGLSLNAQLEREKARIALAQEQSKRMHDSLKTEWQRFQDSKPDKDRSPFVVCDPLQYVAETKIIGPSGGEIGFGPHKLTIPRGALSKSVVITAEAPTSLNVVAKFSPHGLLFNLRMPSKLVLSYKHCFGQNNLPKRIVYVDDNLRIIEYPLSIDARNFGLVLATINHFSGYMVAW